MNYVYLKVVDKEHYLITRRTMKQTIKPRFITLYVYLTLAALTSLTVLSAKDVRCCTRVGQIVLYGGKTGIIDPKY